jgi:hypothetical protein
MSIHEAAGRTGISVARIQEALEKMDPPASKPLPPTMQFTFATTTSREELLELPLKLKLSMLQQIAENQSGAIRGVARTGQTSYVWEMDDAKFPQYLMQMNYRECPPITLSEVVDALRARFPGCKVERVEEWVDVPSRNVGQPPTRVLKSGIKIDWS